MTPLVVAIDNGSQSTKVSVFGPHGELVAFAREPLRATRTGPDGRVQHPDDDLWSSIRIACRNAMGQIPERRSEIVAVGLCTIRFCRAYLDADGGLTEPVLSWMDARVSAPVSEVLPNTRWITTSSGYISHRLTGRFVDTSGNYQGVWPIDDTTWRWSDDPQMFDSTGMPRSMLFELVDPGEMIGTVTADAAGATGLPAGLPVFATSNDKAVEALGCGLQGDGTAVLSLGTYIAAMTVGEQRVDLGSAGWRNFGARPNEYLFESAGIRRGMWTVSWFRELLGHGVSDEELGIAAASVPIGARGLFAVLDWLAPSDAPYRRGALLGFDGSQGRGEIFRSILESIAVTMYWNVRRLVEALGREPERLVVSGGGSRSDLMLSIVANVFGKPVQRTEFPDAAGLGAAITAARGVNIFPTWEHAINEMVHVEKTVLPDDVASAAYRDVARRYAMIGGFTDPLFKAIDRGSRDA